MNVLDLFSGIGGFSLGLERAGMTTVAFCEIEEFPRRVLAKHWPHVPIFHDVRTLKGADVGAVDVICGGYPCQPESLAGKRGGAEDDRWLWPEMHRLVDELRPAWVIGENVAGHISLGLDAVLSDLEASDYTTRAFVIPAVAVDAGHRRDRVWIVAHTRRDRLRDGADKSITVTRCGRTADACAHGETGALAYANRTGRGEQRTSLSNAAQYEAAQCGGWWPPEPDVGRVAHGVPARVDRLRGLGNAVVPQIPEIIGRAIMAAEHA